MHLTSQLLQFHNNRNRGTDTHPIPEINANNDDATTSYTSNDGDNSSFLLIPEPDHNHKRSRHESPNHTQRNNADGVEAAAPVPVRRENNMNLLKAVLKKTKRKDVGTDNDLDSFTDVTCSICCEKINFSSTSATQSVCVTGCGHKFHTSCIGDWININIDINKDANCPECRQTFRSNVTPLYRSPNASMISELSIHFVYNNTSEMINVQVDLNFTGERLIHETLKVLQNPSCRPDSFQVCFFGGSILIPIHNHESLLKAGFDPLNNEMYLNVQQKYRSAANVQCELNDMSPSPEVISSIDVIPYGTSICIGQLKNVSSQTTFKQVRTLINDETFAASSEESVRQLKDVYDLVLTTESGVKWKDTQTLAQAKLQNNDFILLNFFTKGSQYLGC